MKANSLVYPHHFGFSITGFFVSEKIKFKPKSKIMLNPQWFLSLLSLSFSVTHSLLEALRIPKSSLKTGLVISALEALLNQKTKWFGNARWISAYAIILALLLPLTPIIAQPTALAANDNQAFRQQTTADATFMKAFQELQSIHQNYYQIKDNKSLTKLVADQEMEKLRQRSAALYQSMFDIDFTGQLALGEYWHKITPEQRKKYTDDFKSIIQYKFSSNALSNESENDRKARKKLKKFSELKIEGHDQFFDRIFLKQPVTRVKSILPGDEIDTNINFLLVRHDNRFIIYDLYLDGNSLTNDYRNQFYRIINKEGLSGLLGKLDDKATKMKNESKQAAQP